MIVEAAIFDLDGVICDTAKYHFIAWKRLANEFGIDFDEEFNETLKGISRVGSLERILAHGSKEISKADFDAALIRKNEWYLDLISHMNPKEALPGVFEFLDQLVDQNIKMAIGSASKNAPMIIEKLGMNKYFPVIIDGNQVVHGKPDPEVFLKGAEALGVTPQKSIVFEDSVAGIQAANAGGFRSIGIGTEEALSEADLCILGFEKITLNDLI